MLCESSHCFEGTLLFERQEVVCLFLPLDEREGPLVGSRFSHVEKRSFEPVSEYSFDKCNIFIVISIHDLNRRFLRDSLFFDFLLLIFFLFVVLARYRSTNILDRMT